MTWHGWLWDTRRQRWERVCQGDGLGACSHQLGEIARLRGVKDFQTALTGGAVPNFRPRGRKQLDTSSEETQ